MDGDGIAVDDRLADAELVFTTPSHQFPTTVTMSLERRRALLEAVHRNRAVIIEDDYEFEANYCGEPCPALKSLDRDGRVMYVGSFSKSLMPGLRLGFIVAPPAVIEEARALRRLMLRHPPGNNQRTAALFLAAGHYDALIHRLHRAYHSRWSTLGQALERHLPGWSRMPSFGGTSYWVEGPMELDSRCPGRCGPARGHPHRAGRHPFRRRSRTEEPFPPRLLVDRRGPDRTGHRTARPIGKHGPLRPFPVFATAGRLSRRSRFRR